MSTVYKNRNDTAFPSERRYTNKDGDPCIELHSGLTKREYFAAMAMSGLLASNTQGPDIKADWLAKESVQHADSLLKQLES